MGRRSPRGSACPPRRCRRCLAISGSLAALILDSWHDPWFDSTGTNMKHLQALSPVMRQILRKGSCLAALLVLAVHVPNGFAEDEPAPAAPPEIAREYPAPA